MKNSDDYKKNLYTFILALNAIKFMALPSNKNDKQFSGSLIFGPEKIRVIRYQLFRGKLEAAVHICFVEQLFLKLLKIFKKKTQLMGSDFSKFLQPVAIVKIDVLFGIIFHNRQTNNYMTSPVSAPLNILRICEKSHLAFILYICNSSFYLHNLQRYTQNPVERL